jgi:hypothetical protein
MIDQFAITHLFSALRKNTQHGKLVLRVLIAENVLNNRLHLAIDRDGNGVTRRLQSLQHMADVRFQISDGLNVKNVHAVLRNLPETR